MEETKDITRIRHLMARYFDGLTTLAQEQELQRLVNANAATLPADLVDEARLVGMLEAEHELSEEMQQYCEEVLQTLADMPRLKRRRRWIRFAWDAAAVLVAMTLTIVIFYRPEESQPLTARVEQPAAPTDSAETVVAPICETAPKIAEAKPVPKKHVQQALPKVKKVVEEEKTYEDVTDSARAAEVLEESFRLLAAQLDRGRQASEAAGASIVETKETVLKIMNYEEDN